MIKFSLSHSSILNSAGEEVREIANEHHLNGISQTLKDLGVEVLDQSRVNVTAQATPDVFHRLFDIAEDAVENFYGTVKIKFAELAAFVDHLEHHSSTQSGS